VQARLAYATDTFFKSGHVPSVHEGNKREPLVPLGKYWAGYGQVKIGASVEAACESPAHLADALAAVPQNCPCVLTYRPDVDKVFVMLREKADRIAALDAAFLAHLWLHRIHEVSDDKRRRCMPALPCRAGQVTHPDCGDELLASLEWAQHQRGHKWRSFCSQAEARGWKMDDAMLAIGDTRLL
jgi:hypothetical protein